MEGCQGGRFAGLWRAVRGVEVSYAAFGVADAVNTACVIHSLLLVTWPSAITQNRPLSIT